MTLRGQPDDPGPMYSQEHEEDSAFSFEHLHPLAVGLLGTLTVCLAIAVGYWLFAVEKLIGR